MRPADAGSTAYEGGALTFRDPGSGVFDSESRGQALNVRVQSTARASTIFLGGRRGIAASARRTATRRAWLFSFFSPSDCFGPSFLGRPRPRGAAVWIASSVSSSRAKRSSSTMASSKGLSSMLSRGAKSRKSPGTARGTVPRTPGRPTLGTRDDSWCI